MLNYLKKILNGQQNKFYFFIKCSERKKSHFLKMTEVLLIKEVTYIFYFFKKTVIFQKKTLLKKLIFLIFYDIIFLSNN